MNRRYLIALGVFAALILAEYFLQTRLTWENENKRLGGFAAHLYYNPAPPAGKWAAIYSADFAKKFNLPMDGVSEKLNDYVEYMEIISVPARKNKHQNHEVELSYPTQDCILNILTNKNHDIPLDEDSASTKHVTKAERIENQIISIADHMKRIDKPLQFIDVNKYDASYRKISALDFVHSANILSGYDYFSKLNFRCQIFLSSIREDKDINYEPFLRASVIEKNAHKSFQTYLQNEVRIVTVNRDDNHNFITVTVPKALPVLLYEGTEIPLEPTHALINSVVDIPKLIVALPFVLMWGLGAPDVSKANKASRTFQFAAPWPENTPTHFKLEKE